MPFNKRLLWVQGEIVISNSAPSKKIICDHFFKSKIHLLYFLWMSLHELNTRTVDGLSYFQKKCLLIRVHGIILALPLGDTFSRTEPATGESYTRQCQKIEHCYAIYNVMPGNENKPELLRLRAPLAVVGTHRVFALPLTGRSRPKTALYQLHGGWSW